MSGRGRRTAELLEFVLDVRASRLQRTQAMLVAPSVELAQVERVRLAPPARDLARKPGRRTSRTSPWGSDRTTACRAAKSGSSDGSRAGARAVRAQLVNLPHISTHDQDDHATASASRTGDIEEARCPLSLPGCSGAPSPTCRTGRWDRGARKVIPDQRMSGVRRPPRSRSRHRGGRTAAGAMVQSSSLTCSHLAL